MQRLQSTRCVVCACVCICWSKNVLCWSVYVHEINFSLSPSNRGRVACTMLATGKSTELSLTHKLEHRSLVVNHYIYGQQHQYLCVSVCVRIWIVEWIQRFIIIMFIASLFLFSVHHWIKYVPFHVIDIWLVQYSVRIYRLEVQLIVMR